MHEDIIQKVGEVEEDSLYRGKDFGSLKEREANKLAAELLLPIPLINKCLKKGINTIEDLAKKFKVSKDAVSIRLYGIPYDYQTKD